MPVDYLKRILTAKVYEVAVESPLEAADVTVPPPIRRVGLP